jgi:hypothetical protein
MLSRAGRTKQRIYARLRRVECCVSWLASTDLLKYVKIGQSIKQKDGKGKNDNSKSNSVVCAFF